MTSIWTKESFLQELSCCDLCEHHCQVNRLEGETGLCRLTYPVIASTMLHPAPPESYTVFFAGCNYKCLNCQNWSIAHYPDSGDQVWDYQHPQDVALDCLRSLNSVPALLMGADRIFFSGGEATIHLPYIEEIVRCVRDRAPATKVNFDTNGYLTTQSLERVLKFATSITYDIKAYHDDVHQALTGVSVHPVLRNATYIAQHAKHQLWEFRILVIPEINAADIRHLVEFIAELDSALPVCFLAFRPNFVLEGHQGADRYLLDSCLALAEAAGLTNVHGAGTTGLPGKVEQPISQQASHYTRPGASIAAAAAYRAGCHTAPRACALCEQAQQCPIKKYHSRQRF